MELKAKFYITDDDGNKFMGIGVLWLLEKTRQLGSLRRAAKDMTISYTKAYNMINRLESCLGVDVLERKKGGSRRDGASLTPFGAELIRIYSEFQDEARARLEEPYDKFDKELTRLKEEFKNG